MSRPRIRRIALDLVEIKIGLQLYHIISDETPTLVVNKFIDGKMVTIGAEERDHILIWYHEFRQKEEGIE